MIDLKKSMYISIFSLIVAFDKNNFLHNLKKASVIPIYDIKLT